MTRHINPEDDDVEHINTYTGGKSRLGRLITNLSDLSVNHPEFGLFRTMEGLYYYRTRGVKVKQDDGTVVIHRFEDLRALSGFAAKKYGETLPPEWNENLYKEIKDGIRCKIEQHAELKKLVIESTLPFEHYYVYGKKVVIPKSSKWFCKMLEELRAELL